MDLDKVANLGPVYMEEGCPSEPGYSARWVETQPAFTCNSLLPGVLTIYMGKPDISVGNSNGSRHSVWKDSENMGCDLR